MTATPHKDRAGTGISRPTLEKDLTRSSAITRYHYGCGNAQELEELWVRKRTAIVYRGHTGKMFRSFPIKRTHQKIVPSPGKRGPDYRSTSLSSDARCSLISIRESPSLVSSLVGAGASGLSARQITKVSPSRE